MLGLAQLAKARSSLLKQFVQPARLLATETDIQQPVLNEKTINQVTLLGRVGSDPQKRGNEEHPVVIFSLATHLNYKQASSGLNVQKPEWHRICCFKPNLRDYAYQYVKKGQRVHITGRLTYGEITDSEGVSRTTTAIIAEDLIFLGSGNNNRQ
ncbi:single-stranded DNA-binding protein, mitochondrial [Neocloeon triangulifer]|uniref:single-stranded DNA-binding protein, mitochondrial n=1 Tax=Neocloeon triangulifer TaxID=2078957 RepID=UPI00286F0DBF|nr:single-stranded DNA-binding protein, mitochondrial [Neocloeon triangulifer]